MPEVPDRPFCPATQAKEKKAKETSKLYWCHPTVTVYAYMHATKPEQARINAECQQLQALKGQLPAGITPAQFLAMSAEQQRQVDALIENR